MHHRVLYVHHRGQTSGAARSLAELIAHLPAPWTAHVLTPPGPVVRLFEKAGASVTTAPVALFQHTWDSSYSGRRWLLLGRAAVELPPHALVLHRLLRRGKFSLVHLNDSPLAAAAALARRHRLPVVWHLRSALSHEGRVLPSVIQRIIDGFGDAAIAIDHDVADSFALRIPTTIVFNSVKIGLRLDRPDARGRLGISPDRVAIGFIGNLRRIKGWPELVEAASELRDEPAQFVIVGSGVRPPAFFRTPYGRTVAALGLTSDDETELRSLVQARGLERSFVFVPFTDNLGEVYSALDIVAFPNQGVGLGRPVLEAAAYGLPTVASGSPHGGGVLVPERTGLLLARPTPSALTDALRRLIRDARLREEQGRAAFEHAREHFDPRRNAAAVARVYSAVTRLSTSGR